MSVHFGGNAKISYKDIHTRLLLETILKKEEKEENAENRINVKHQIINSNEE